MADCNSTYEYTDPHGRFTGTLHCALDSGAEKGNDHAAE